MEKLKLAKTGVLGLDKLLGGGVPRGTSILLLEEPGTKGATFAIGLLGEGLKRGEYGQFVSYDHPPVLVRSIADNIGLNLRPYEREKKLQIIDAYSSVTGLKEFPSDVEYIIDDLSDLSRVHRILSRARDALGNKANDKLRYVHHTFSVMMLYGSEIPVLKFMQHLTIDSKLRGDIGIFIVDPNAHSPTTVRWAMNFASAVIELSLRPKEGEYSRWLTVRKMPGVNYIMKSIPYYLTHKGIVLGKY